MISSPKWWHCDTHGAGNSSAWGCPECVREMRAEIERMRALLERVEVAMAAAEWAGIPGRWSEVHDEVRAALKEQGK